MAKSIYEAKRLALDLNRVMDKVVIQSKAIDSRVKQLSDTIKRSINKKELNKRNLADISLPGDETYILIDNYPALTIIDDQGVQRFPQNDFICWLVNSGKVTLNDFWEAFYDDELPRDGMIQIYIDLGYSVTGFKDHWDENSLYCQNTGEFVEIINPLWLDTTEDEM